jgi:hypothetical protein
MTNKRANAVILSSIAAICLSGASGAADTAHEHDADAEKKPAQELTPPKQIEMYLDGYHCYKSEAKVGVHKQKQVRVAHYCSHYSPDLIMCSVYDGNGKTAKLIGIEYVVPETVYKALPAGEKKYWHPHDGEVSGGLLTMPGMPAEKEKAVLGFVSHTYGKTWNLWQPGDKLPYGEPKLMWPITADKLADATKESIEKRKTDYTF